MTRTIFFKSNTVETAHKKFEDWLVDNQHIQIRFMKDTYYKEGVYSFFVIHIVYKG